MKKEDQIRQLIEEMKHDLEDWESEEEVNFEEKYGQRVQEAGECNFMICLFKYYYDSMFSSLIGHFFFAWKDLHYEDWKEVLYAMPNNRGLMYEFVIFYGQVLAINVKKMILEDKKVSEYAKSYADVELVRGGPKPNSLWVDRMFQENGMEATALWKRLKEEGAPMIINI